MTEQWVKENLNRFVFDNDKIATEYDEFGNVISWVDVPFFIKLFDECVDLTPVGIKTFDKSKGYGYTERGILNLWFGI